jgi:branched-chain amino acid transport system permease protein
VDIDYPRILGFTLKSAASGYYLIWAVVLFTILASFRLKSSRLGRAWEAIREDELASNAMGINTFWLKILAFITGAGFAGAAGALFAVYTGGVYPSNYDFGALNTIYCMLIIGGMGNVRGVVLGALLLSIVPELLREYGDWRMIGYGLLLVVIVIVRPNGLLGDLDFSWLSKLLRKKGSAAAGSITEAEPGKAEAQPALDTSEFLGNIRKLDIDPSRVLLELKDIQMVFGGLVAVSDFSLDVKEGQIVSIIGPNGAGKTTIFNMITGIYAPTKGKILFNGRDVTGLKPFRIVKHGIARTFQNIRLYDKMNVLDNVKTAQYCRTKTSIFSTLLRLPSVVKTEELIDRNARGNLRVFGDRFDNFLGQKAKDLSYAARRRLEIARALSTSPRMILLDEPSAGMNPQETAEIGQFIKYLRDEFGYTFLLIEHKLDFVKNLSDKVIAMDYGRKITEGDYMTVATNEHVIEAYLGRKKHDD